VLLLVMRSRRRRRRPPAAGTTGAAGTGRVRVHGAHEQRRPDRSQPLSVPQVPERDAAVADLFQAARPDSPAAGEWRSPAGWQGGGIGEIARSPGAPSRPFMTTTAKGTGGPRGRAAAASGSAGPPWEPAPVPERGFGPLGPLGPFGPLPAVPPGTPPPEASPSIRLPGDMGVPTASTAPAPPADLASAAFGFGPVAGTDTDTDAPAGAGESLGFAAAPVPTDYPAPPADPSYIWDLAATDVFPVAAGPDTPAEAPAPGSPDAEQPGEPS